MSVQVDKEALDNIVAEVQALARESLQAVEDNRRAIVAHDEQEQRRNWSRVKSWGRWSANIARASSPDAATLTTCPDDLSMRTTALVIIGSSSTASTMLNVIVSAEEKTG